MSIRLWRRHKREASARKVGRTSQFTLSEPSTQERRFLENSSYLLPKDVQEMNRLDFQHFLLRRLLGGNYAAPLPQSTRSILDVGCGTGLWVREMAQQFPRAHVIGLDLELSNTAQNHPANCRFVTGNILQGLPFSSERFDVVHQRLLVAALPAQVWPVVVKELARVTCSSGWVELLEIGQSVTNPGPATSHSLAWWMELSKRTSFDITLVEHLGDMLQDAGLQHVHQRTIKAPAGQWGGHAGVLLAADMVEVLRAVKQRFCQMLQLAPTLVDATIEALPAEWEQYHTMFHFYLAYGQKEEPKISYWEGVPLRR